MGLSRFGIGGCCQCRPDTDPPPPKSERAGECGWCGLYDPNEYTLEQPVDPSKLCKQFVFDDFSYMKDLPRVPYWNWQDGDQAELNHLDSGHFINSSKNRYCLVNTVNQQPVPGKLADMYCKPNAANTGSGCSSSYLTRLGNLPPFYGPGLGYPWPWRYENGILVNSPTNKTDLIPLRQSVSLDYNTPLNQWPKYLFHYDYQGPPYPCIDGNCEQEQYVAHLHARLVDWGNSDYYCVGDSPGSMVFKWNAPSACSPSFYGLFVEEFSVTSIMKVPFTPLFHGNQIIATEPYLPTKQTVTITYYIGPGGRFGRNSAEAIDHKRVEIFYKNSFNLSIRIKFSNWPSDNRKCLLAVLFLVDNETVHAGYHVIAKPGWRQDGTPTDEQSCKQFFCPGNISAVNEIIGHNFSLGSINPPWAYGNIALWDANQTPRESFYIDNWYADYERL